MFRDRDRVRQWLNLLLAPLQTVAAAMAPLFGIGHPIGEMSDASATPAVPADYAFAIWTPIFALGIVYAGWQALPTRREDPLLRRVGWWTAAAFAANILWMVVAQLGANGWHLVLLILLVLVPSVYAYLLEARAPVANGQARRWLLRPLLGLQAGWVTAASFANVSAAARAEGVALLGLGPTSSAVFLVLATGLAAAALLWAGRGSPWFAGAVAWALMGVVLANMGERDWNLPATVAAAAMLVLLGAVLRGVWRREDRALFGGAGSRTGEPGASASGANTPSGA
jgi:hypothetical protein